MNMQMNTKRILIFLAFAFGIPWTAELVIFLTVKTDDMLRVLNAANYIIVVPVPMLASIATRLITKEGWGHLMLWPNIRRGWRFYLAVWLLPFLAVIAGGAIYYLLFPQSFDFNLGEFRKLLIGTPYETASNPWPLLLSYIVSAIIIYVPLGAVVSIGEELGWRAYLLPKLVEHFFSSSGVDPAPINARYTIAARKAALLVGLIWGLWHWPLFFISMMTYDPGMPATYPLVYLVTTCSLSVLLCWVTLRSGSVWPAAIGHGAIKPSSAVAMFPLKGTAIRLLGPDPTGLIGGIGYLVLALVLLFNRRAFAEEKKARSESVPVVVSA